MTSTGSVTKTGEPRRRWYCEGTPCWSSYWRSPSNSKPLEGVEEEEDALRREARVSGRADGRVRNRIEENRREGARKSVREQQKEAEKLGADGDAIAIGGEG